MPAPPLLIEILADVGLIGWGECCGPGAVARAVVETLFKPRLIGPDPFDAEVI